MRRILSERRILSDAIRSGLHQNWVGGTLGGSRALLKPLARERLVDLAFRRVVVVAVRESRFQRIKARLVSREDLRVVCSVCESLAAQVLDRFLT